MDTELTWSIGRSVSIVGSHVVAATHGRLQGDVLHNVFSVRIAVASPWRPPASGGASREGGLGEEP